MRFATNTRLLLDSIAALPGLRRILGRGDNTPVHHLPEKAAKIAFDLFECLRTASRVPHIGEARIAAMSLPGLIPQHPRYRGYWYDPDIHSLVGMQLGIDLIRHQGKYHVVENNLSAALKDRRRRIYNEPLDPVVWRLAEIAKAHRFETLVVYARRWPDWYLAEFRQAERDFGVRIMPTSFPYLQPDAPHPMAALPEKLAPRTMYAICPYRGGPLDCFIEDKYIAGVWLNESIGHSTAEDGLLAAIPSHDRLTVPPLDETAPWPNLVIKLSRSGRGEHVLAGRFRTEADASAALGLTRPDGLPQAFKVNRLVKAIDRAFPTLTTVYQPFIPPEINADGHPETLRMHVFVSPLVHSFLSAHRFVGSQQVPPTAPLGLLENDDTFIVKYARGASYARAETAIEREIAAAANQFGRILDSAVRSRFEIGPPDMEQPPHHAHPIAAERDGDHYQSDPAMDVG